MTTRPSPSEHVAGWRDLLPENRTGWECDGSVSICYQRVDALREALARLEAAEDGLFRVVQAIGEDMDGARNASEYFGPLTICTNPPITDPAGIAVHLVSAYRAEMEAENDTAAARLEAAEKVIADALDVFRPGASVPLGVSEAHHFDRLLAEGYRILSAYTKGTD